MNKAFILACFLATTLISLSAKAYDQSLSIQIGVNGNSQDSSSYGLQLVPPDLSYSKELFDNDSINISTASFYDNIGVKVKHSNFSYRVGQRIDVGLELGKYTPYITAGLGIIKNDHHYQTSPVYGVGFLVRISERFLLVNEVNIQNVRYQNSRFDILNISTGVVYAF